MNSTNTRLACLLLLVVGLVAATSAVYGADGRWKLGGDGSCFFDPDDTGPDQCSPNSSPDVPVAGRWKLGGDGSCYFDQNDSGPNQCTPPTPTPLPAGRWKLGGDGTCVFDPNDSGPDQCRPATAALADTRSESLAALVRSLQSSSVVPSPAH